MYITSQEMVRWEFTGLSRASVETTTAYFQRKKWFEDSWAVTRFFLQPPLVKTWLGLVKTNCRPICKTSESDVSKDGESALQDMVGRLDETGVFKSPSHCGVLVRYPHSRCT